MNSEKCYCVLVGKPNLALQRLEQALQHRFEVITAENGDAAILAATVFHPTLAVIPQESGGGMARLARQMDAARPGIAIVHSGNFDTAEPADFACPASEPTTDSTTASPAATAGRPTVSGMNNRGHRQPDDTAERPGRVTHRERQVLMLLMRGLSMKAAARSLAISPRTVAFHKYQAMAKNGLHNNADLLAFAFREGILTVPAASSGESMMRC
jgi:DNA-binding NarL/FixJ family response regulator